MSLLAYISVAKDAEPLGIRGHHAVFDPVMNHLDEMARAARSAMQIAEFGRAREVLTPWRARDLPRTRRQHRWLFRNSTAFGTAPIVGRRGHMQAQAVEQRVTRRLPQTVNDGFPSNSLRHVGQRSQDGPSAASGRG